MARTLEEIDAALEEAERKIARQAKKIAALENAESDLTTKIVDATAEVVKLKRMMRATRHADRLHPPIPEDAKKRGEHGRTEKVLVGGKVVVRARKPG